MALNFTTTDVGFINSGDSKLVITGYAPTITFAGSDQTVEVPVGSLSTDGSAPEVNSGIVAVFTGALGLTGYQVLPNPENSPTLLPTLGSVAFTGAAPTLAFDISKFPDVDNLAFTGQQVTRKAGLFFQSDAPTVQETHSDSPLVGSVSFTGNVPQVVIQGGGNLVVAPDAVTLGISSDSSTVHWTATIAVTSMSFVGNAPSADITASQAPELALLAFTGNQVSIELSESAPTVIIGVDPGTQILNHNAGPEPSHFTICDRSGWKLRRNKYVMEWDGKRVRKDSYEPKHPQLTIRGIEQGKKGSVSPEQDNEFISTAITPDDL